MKNGYQITASGSRLNLKCPANYDYEVYLKDGSPAEQRIKCSQESKKKAEPIDSTQACCSEIEVTGYGSERFNF